MIKQFKRVFLGLPLFFLNSLILIFLFLLIVPRLSLAIFPDFTVLVPIILRLPDPRFIALAIFLAAFIAFLAAKLLYLNKLKNIRDFPLVEQASLFLIAIFLSRFFWTSFSIFNRFGSFGLGLLFLFFILFLPNFIQLVVDFIDTLSRFKKKRRQIRRLTSKEQVTYLIISMFIYIGLILLSLPIIKVINQKMRTEKIKEVRKSRNPVIIKVEPQIVYYATKVIVFGSNLGWKENDKVRLMTRKEEVRTDLWTDSKIIFTVPLHWKQGVIEFWIEKNIEWNGKPEIARSNEFTLKLIPISTSFTPDDNNYFDQLKYLNKEVLKINGY